MRIRQARKILKRRLAKSPVAYTKRTVICSTQRLRRYHGFGSATVSHTWTPESMRIRQLVIDYNNNVTDDY
jgi:hypothetical protein